MNEQKPVIEIRQPITPADIEQTQIARNEAWGAGSLNFSDEQTSNKDLIKNGAIFLTAFADGKGAGTIICTRMDYDLKNPVRTWLEVSDEGRGGNHVPDGKTLYVLSLGVSPKYRGGGIGAQLVYKTQELCVKLNCKCVVLGCRIPDYHKYAEIPIDQYILLKRADGEFLDKEMRFYARCGMRFLKPMPEYMSGSRADPDSLNYGVMTIWSNPFYTK